MWAKESMYSNHPRLQMLEMVKEYVRFMVENPQYLEVFHLADRADLAKVKDGIVIVRDNKAFNFFNETSVNYYSEPGIKEELHTKYTLFFKRNTH